MPPITTIESTSPVCCKRPSSGLTSWLNVPYSEPARPQIPHDRQNTIILTRTTSMPRLSADQRHFPVEIEQRRRVAAEHREGGRRERELPREARERVPCERDQREIDADEDDALRVRPGDDHGQHRKHGAARRSCTHVE